MRLQVYPMIQISDAESRIVEALWSKEPLTAEADLRRSRQGQ